MADEKLLTVRETSQLLDISEREAIDLAQNGDIPAYKVGGQYLRFKRGQVETFKKQRKRISGAHSRNMKYTFGGRIRDFFYFNDFYILSAFIIIWMLIVIIYS